MHLNLQSPHEGFSWVFRFSSELFSSQAIIIIPTNPHFQAHPLLAPTPPSSILWTIHHCQAEPSSPPHVPVPHLVPKVPPSLTQENSNFTSEGHVHSQTCHSAEQRLPITQYQTHGQKPQVPPQAHCSLSTKPSQVRYAIYKLQNLRLTRASPHLKTQHPNPFNNRLHLRLFHTSHLKPNSFPQHPKVLLRIPLTNAEAGGPQTQGRWRGHWAPAAKRSTRHHQSCWAEVKVSYTLSNLLQAKFVAQN